MQFLLEGVRCGERCLYVTLSESRAELNGVAPSHGWNRAGIDIFEVAEGGVAEEEYTDCRLGHPQQKDALERMAALRDTSSDWSTTSAISLRSKQDA